MLQIRSVPAAIVAALLAAIPAPGVGARASPCGEDAFAERIASVEAWQIALESGRVVRLADIRLADEAQALSWLARWRGASMAGLAGRKADRWGRLPARLVPAGGARDLAEGLVAEGLAIVDAGEEDDLCRPALLAAEEEARRGRRGVWASEAPLAAGDAEAIAAREGRFTLVEGRIVSIGERARWTYLNFGRDFARDFAVSIPRRRWQRMKGEGISADTLRGRLVRVRGIVEIRRAPGMELSAAAAIERLDGDGPDAGPPARDRPAARRRPRP